MKMLFAFLWVKIQNDVMTLLGRCSLKGQAKQKKKKQQLNQNKKRISKQECLSMCNETTTRYSVLAIQWICKKHIPHFFGVI